MFEVQSQQPGNFSLHVQDRVRGVQLVLQASHLRLERAQLRIQRVAFGRFRAALLRGQLPQRALALRQAVRCELYNPSRRSRRPTSPGCVQRSASSRIRSRYSAVNWRRFGLATTSGSGVGLARPALGASSLRSSTPRAGTETSFNVIESLSAVIGFHLHRPTEIPKVAGVSVMLAERAVLHPWKSITEDERVQTANTRQRSNQEHANHSIMPPWRSRKNCTPCRPAPGKIRKHRWSLCRPLGKTERILPTALSDGPDFKKILHSL